MRTSALALMFLLAALVLGHPAASDAQLVLYDDFSSSLIDPTKWLGTVAVGGAANPTTESARVIKSGRLELRLNQYGLSTSDTGTSTGQYRISVPNPTPITTWQAAVTVLSADVEACPTNLSTTVRARAQVSGGFFNDGTSSGANDRTGDVIAGVQKIADTVLGNVIQAFIVRCTDASCSTTGPLSGLSSQVFATAWAPNKGHTLTLTWDATGNQFVYAVKPVFGGSTETITLPYAESDAKSPIVPFRQLVVNNSAANCNGSQKHAFMDVHFDSVMVNP
jgi:hypothetical protein